MRVLALFKSGWVMTSYEFGGFVSDQSSCSQRYYNQNWLSLPSIKNHRLRKQEQKISVAGVQAHKVIVEFEQVASFLCHPHNQSCGYADQSGKTIQTQTKLICAQCTALQAGRYVRAFKVVAESSIPIVVTNF